MSNAASGRRLERLRASAVERARVLARLSESSRVAAKMRSGNRRPKPTWRVAADALLWVSRLPILKPRERVDRFLVNLACKCPGAHLSEREPVGECIGDNVLIETCDTDYFRFVDNSRAVLTECRGKDSAATEAVRRHKTTITSAFEGTFPLSLP